MDKFKEITVINIDVIRHLYINKGYRWYVLNKVNDKVFGPFDRIEETESFTKSDKNSYIQFMDEKTIDAYEYPLQEYIGLD